MADQKTTQLTANTSPAVTDLLTITDDPSGTASTQKIELSNLLKFINGLTEDTAPDANADYLATYDASAGAVKKVSLSAFGDKYPMEGRLTLETGVPVSTTDQSAKTTLYLTQYKGNQIAVYDGSAWFTLTFASDLSITLSGLTASLPYDVFVYSNSGTLTLELTAWTDTTTRATAITMQDGVYVKSGATTRRYIGTICITSTAGQCEDSYTRRLVYNYYNQAPRYLGLSYISSHNYTTAAWRYWNNSQANSQVEFVLGIAANFVGIYRANITSLAGGGVSFALDSTSPNGMKGEQFNNAGDAASSDMFVAAVGYHYWTGVEYGNAGGMTAERISINTTIEM